MEERISEELKKELQKELEVLVEACIHSAIRDAEKCLRDLQVGKLTFIEIKTLGVIGEKGAKSMKEIAAALEVAVSTPTTTIDRLVKKKLVQRYAGVEDRRMVFVELTEDGKKVIREFLKQRLKRGADVLSLFKPEEILPTIEKIKGIAEILKKE